MAGRTPAEAVHAYLEPIQLAVSCVTRSVCHVSGGYHVVAGSHALTLGRGESVRLQGDTGLSLLLIQSYRIIEADLPGGSWRVTTTGYTYGYDAPDGHELIAFHWHPSVPNSVTFPHLHLGYASRVGRSDLASAHIPTGRVTIEDVIRLGIRELGVKPLRGDWEAVLDGTEVQREAWRPW